MERFSVQSQYFCYFVGVIAGAWRKLVSRCFFFRFVWESGEQNMDLTTDFVVPNAHHVFGSRTGFSHSAAPSGVSFGGSWIFFGVLGKLFRALAASILDPCIRKGIARQFASWGCLGN